MEQAMLERAASPMEDINGGDLGQSRHAPQIAPGGTEVTDPTNGAATDGLEQARTRRSRRDRTKGKEKEVIRPLEISNTPRAPAAMQQNTAALSQPPRTCLKRPETVAREAKEKEERLAWASEKRSSGECMTPSTLSLWARKNLWTRRKCVEKREMTPSREEPNHRLCLSGC